MPWKSNPVMIFYNKDLMKKAGVDPENPPLVDVRRLPRHQRQDRDQQGRPGRHLARARRSEFFQSWFDFYPLYAAETGGKQLVEDGKSTFNDAAGKAVANFWATMYAKGYAPKEKYNGDSFADGKAAMAIVGPWAIAVYGDKVNWGAAPVPTSTGMSADETHTFSDAKNVAIYSACKAKGTAWDVAEVRHQQGRRTARCSTRPARCRCAPTSRPPTRTTSRRTRSTRSSPSHAARTVEVPNVDQLDRDLAEVPRRVQLVGDLRRRPRWTTL